MLRTKILVHGVPDTPAIWGPLVAALGELDGPVHCPALPGFVDTAPHGFPSTKEVYTDWLVEQIRAAHAETGPVDLIGHDWGAIFVLRAASLVPELVRSWTVSDAMIDPDYRGHSMARKWATPLVGELIMALARPQALAAGLVEAGVPEDIAAHDAETWTRAKRRAILKLYRSADGLRFSGDWVERLANMPKHGLVVWGENDPYVELHFAEAFAERWSVPLHIERGAGHWAIAQRADSIATRIKTFWAGIPA
ncbi:MAG: alpha/beta fold hydrolase [Parasphingopyxis sp.]